MLNKLGVWQLILMAQESDRKAIDELFYISNRAAYMVTFSMLNNKKTALSILLEGYVNIFQHLDELNRAEDFIETLTRFNIGRIEKASPTGLSMRFDNNAVNRASDWDSFLQSVRIIEFDTLPDSSLPSAANEVIKVFNQLPLSQRLSVFLYYYAEMQPDEIARLLGASVETIKGSLFIAISTAMPKLRSIQGKTPAIQNVTTESLINWALKNNSAYSLNDSELTDYYNELLSKLVEAGVIDTEMIDEDTSDIVEIDIKDMGTLPNPSFFMSRAFKIICIVLAILFFFVCLFLGVKKIEQHNEMRSIYEIIWSRTTLPYTYTTDTIDDYIIESILESANYSDEEETETTKEEEEKESTTAATTTAPKQDLGGLSYSEEGGTITITGFDNSLSAVTVPSSINGKAVTAIGANAFFNSTMSSISLPKSIKTIGSGAFYSCAGLRSISIPSGVTKIPENAFRSCSSLMAVSIPNTVTSISAQAFYKCSSLHDIVLPSSITSIGDWAFSNCSSLETITIPASVKSLGKSAFYECSDLKSCDIPSNSKIKELGEWTFFDCISLKTFTVPKEVTAIPANCFYGCKGLTSVSLPYGLVSIGSSAFTECASLKSVSFSANLRRIESSAFSGCISITRLDLPFGTKSIAAGAFSNCTGLTIAVIPTSVSEIGENAFGGCPSLTVSCSEGSVAEAYAVANSINCTTN